MALVQVKERIQNEKWPKEWNIGSVFSWFFLIGALSAFPLIYLFIYLFWCSCIIFIVVGLVCECTSGKNLENREWNIDAARYWGFIKRFSCSRLFSSCGGIMRWNGLFFVVATVFLVVSWRSTGACSKKARNEVPRSSSLPLLFVTATAASSTND